MVERAIRVTLTGKRRVGTHGNDIEWTIAGPEVYLESC
jgi:hypothetical protein